MKILCIIPARGGSKGIKDKNIINVCGKPLIAYSIEKALMLKNNNLIEEVIVSTDCSVIADISKKYGASVPFLRPSQLSEDTSKSIDYYLHALNFFDKNNRIFDAVLLLQPTSPLRSYQILKESIMLFNSVNSDSLISVYNEEYINDLVMYKKSKGENLVPFNSLHNKGVRRQEHGSVYVRNGAIYLTRTEYILKEEKIISDNPLYVEMSKNDSINIDTIEDLELVRRVLCK